MPTWAWITVALSGWLIVAFVLGMVVGAWIRANNR